MDKGYGLGYLNILVLTAGFGLAAGDLGDSFCNNGVGMALRINIEFPFGALGPPFPSPSPHRAPSAS